MDDILRNDTHYDGVKQQLIILCILIRAFVPTASVEYITIERAATDQPRRFIATIMGQL